MESVISEREAQKQASLFLNMQNDSKYRTIEHSLKFSLYL
jgi:hypothetical protein